ncbi:trypco2 family protein [Desulfuromonas thiophila]|uniref:trypco2 family protein n=1 Tax=Desulfuromonas thiophila TaxID=57664 RepID=UPI0029F55F42|nr:trypco2 family protein [Desulfuromonas thiophila]
MELQEFITETLLGISNGIREANNVRLDKKPADPNASRTFFLRPGSRSENGAGIEFDVAVTTKKIGEGKAGAKLKLTVVEAELGGSGEASKESVSRIKFTINVGQWVG